MIRFKHLQQLNITYASHFKNSMSYSFKSLRASCYFFIHAFYPDVYVYNGSKTICELNKVFNEKK